MTRSAARMYQYAGAKVSSGFIDRAAKRPLKRSGPRARSDLLARGPGFLPESLLLLLLPPALAVGRLLVVGALLDLLEHSFLGADPLEPLQEFLRGLSGANGDLDQAAEPPSNP